MDNDLKCLIKNINTKIEYYENIDENTNIKEIELLEKIIQNNSFLNIKDSDNCCISEILLAAIIINNKYDDIDEVVDIINKSDTAIDNLDSFGLLYLFIKCRKEYPINNNELNKFLYKIHDDYVTVNESKEFLKKFIRLIQIADEKILFTLTTIKEITEKKSDLSDLLSSDYKDISKKGSNINKTINNAVLEEYNVENIIKELNRISEYYKKLEAKNNKTRKEKWKNINRLKELKNILLLSSNKEEIINIDKIVNLLDDELQKDVLKYIENKNNNYHASLEEEYKHIKENLITNYISLFLEKNIDFNEYTDEEKESILKINIKTIEKIFNFLKTINYDIDKNVINIITKTNMKTIDNISKYIKKGILTNDFVKNNIDIINDGYLYSVLITNIDNFIQYGINIMNLEDLNIFLANTDIILQNLSISEEYKINIKTRNLKNYNFLSIKNLEEKIIELNNLNINLNENLELLNLDFNVIKRIKICLNIGLDIYDGKKIKENILNEKEFFIPDSKLDMYLPKNNENKILSII